MNAPRRIGRRPCRRTINGVDPADAVGRHGPTRRRMTSVAVAPLIVQWLRTQYLRLPQVHEHEEGAVTVELGRRPPEEDRW